MFKINEISPKMRRLYRQHKLHEVHMRLILFEIGSTTQRVAKAIAKKLNTTSRKNFTMFFTVRDRIHNNFHFGIFFSFSIDVYWNVEMLYLTKIVHPGFNYGI